MGLALKRVLLAAAVAVSLFGQTAVSPSNRELFDQIDPILADLSKITGLRVMSKVDRDFITRENLKSFLQTRIDEVVKPEEIRVEELTLKLFGFIPEDYNLRDSTISLLTEQAAAFYDYRKKKMFLLESAPEVSQRYVLVHELAHALADQHFSLERFIKRSANDDSATARMAVMEGQAQWLMYEAMSMKTNQSLRKDPTMVKMFVNLSSSGLSAFPELSGAPMYIRESLLFPYTRGLLFQQAVIDRMGDHGFSEVFRRPPSNSQQVIHPELYFDKRKSTSVKVGGPKGRYEEVSDGELGEFDIHVMLKQYVDDATAERLAPKWRGGRYRVWEHRESKNPVLGFALEFDAEAGAEEFKLLYRDKILPAKKRRNGSPRVEHKGSRVEIYEGLE